MIHEIPNEARRIDYRLHRASCAQWPTGQMFVQQLVHSINENVFPRLYEAGYDNFVMFVWTLQSAT